MRSSSVGSLIIFIGPNGPNGFPVWTTTRGQVKYGSRLGGNIGMIVGVFFAYFCCFFFDPYYLHPQKKA